MGDINLDCYGTARPCVAKESIALDRPFTLWFNHPNSNSTSLSVGLFSGDLGLVPKSSCVFDPSEIVHLWNPFNFTVDPTRSVGMQVVKSELTLCSTPDILNAIKADNQFYFRVFDNSTFCSIGPFTTGQSITSVNFIVPKPHSTTTMVPTVSPDPFAPSPPFSPDSNVFPSDQGISLTTIVSIALGAFLILTTLLIGLVYVCRRRRSSSALIPMAFIGKDSFLFEDSQDRESEDDLQLPMAPTPSHNRLSPQSHATFVTQRQSVESLCVPKRLIVPLSRHMSLPSPISKEEAVLVADTFRKVLSSPLFDSSENDSDGLSVISNPFDDPNPFDQGI